MVHLAANAQTPMTTQLLSKAGHVRLAPLDAETARTHLNNLLACWQAGMGSPLPLAPQAAFAWLGKDGSVEGSKASSEGSSKESSDEDIEESDAYRAAASAYEGDRFRTGEVQQSAYLARQWPSFEALYNAHAQGHGFATLVDTLYAPLYRAVKE